MNTEKIFVKENTFEEEEIGMLNGYLLGTPTVKELIQILSGVPEDYCVTCCGTDGYLYLSAEEKYVTIDTEPYLD